MVFFTNRIFDKIITLFFSTEFGVAGRQARKLLSLLSHFRSEPLVLLPPAAPRPKTSRKV